MWPTNRPINYNGDDEKEDRPLSLTVPARKETRDRLTKIGTKERSSSDTLKIGRVEIKAKSNLRFHHEVVSGCTGFASQVRVPCVPCLFNL